MTDMLPREPAQLEWLQAKLPGIAGVQEIWPTDWKLDAAAERTVRALLAAEGATVTG